MNLYSCYNYFTLDCNYSIAGEVWPFVQIIRYSNSTGIIIMLWGDLIASKYVGGMFPITRWLTHYLGVSTLVVQSLMAAVGNTSLSSKKGVSSCVF